MVTLENISELENRINSILSKDELQVSILTAMEKVNTIEELLVLKWQFTKYVCTNFSSNKYVIFSENLERISYNNALVNETLIIEDLINGASLKQIMDKYNVTRESIKKIIVTHLETDNYDERLLDLISKFETNIIPEHDREFIIAKVAVTMFVESKCFSSTLIYKKFGCTYSSTFKYLNILEATNHPLYKQYIRSRDEYRRKISSDISKETRRKDYEERRNKIDYIKDLDSKGILELLSDPYKEEFLHFCLYYNIDTDILKQMLRDDENLKYLFASKASQEESIREIYNQQIIKYKALIKYVIKKIIILSKDKFKKPLDLYDYYTTTKFDFKSLGRASLSFNDIKNNKLILQYIDKFPDVFAGYDDKRIRLLKQTNILSCCNDSIRFTNIDLTKALEDINEKNLPKENGVLYYAIKRQVDLRDINVKKKKN